MLKKIKKSTLLLLLSCMTMFLSCSKDEENLVVYNAMGKITEVTNDYFTFVDDAGTIIKITDFSNEVITPTLRGTRGVLLFLKTSESQNDGVITMEGAYENFLVIKVVDPYSKKALNDEGLSDAEIVSQLGAERINVTSFNVTGGYLNVSYIVGFDHYAAKMYINLLIDEQASTDDEIIGTVHYLQEPGMMGDYIGYDNRIISFKFEGVEAEFPNWEKITLSYKPLSGTAKSLTYERVK